MADDVGPRELPPEASRLAEVLRAMLPDLQERHGIVTLALFGSYVRGDQHPGSDLDLLVEFARTPDLLAFIGLEHELSDLLGIKVDLVMRTALRPGIGRVILREAVAL